MIFIKSRIVVVIATFTAGSVQAVDLDWVRGVSTGLEYRSSETSVDEIESSSSESSVTVTPFVGVSATGRRTTFSLDASLVARASNDTDESDISPRINAASSIYSENNNLQFDSSATVQQRNVDSPFLENDTLFNSSTTERVVTLSAGPQYQQNFGRTSVGASYTVGTTASSDTDNSRSVVQAAVVEVVQLLPNPQWIVGSRISSQHTGFESSPSSQSRILSVYTGYQFRKNLTGLLSAGRELIDVENALTDTDGNIWAVGVNWRIGRRVVVDASYTERAFGRQPNLSITFNGRRSTVALSWTRDLGISSVANNIQFGGENLPEANELPVDQQTGQVIDPDSSSSTTLDPADLSLLPLFQESSNINENVTLSYVLRGRVSTINASVSRVHQDNLVSAESIESTLLNLSVSRQLTRASSVLLRASFGDTTDDRTDGTSSRIGAQWDFQF